MVKRYIISLTGANRVGILAAVTTALDELRGNLFQADIAVMPPFCSILLSAEFPESRSTEIVSDHLRDLCRPFAVEVRVSEISSDDAIQPAPLVAPFILTVSGSDQPGVLRMLSSKLSESGIDIQNLYAERCERDRTFSMELELSVPAALDIRYVREQIHSHCTEVGLTVSLDPAADFRARHSGTLRDVVRAETQ